MKRIALIVIVILSCFCGLKQEKVEKILEDGVEVIINHREPYRLKEEPSNLIFEELFKVDTEMDETAETGLTDISEFNVDSSGNLYFANYQNPESYYFKFDKTGKFVSAFGKKGQGPGEIQTTGGFVINHLDEIEVFDYGNKKLHVFNGEGELVRDVPISFVFHRAISLRNGNYLIGKDIADLNGEYLFQIPLVLYRPDFSEIKELDRMRIPNYVKSKKRRGDQQIFVFDISDENIFIGNEERNYEIWIYDFQGNLKRKIRKDYKKVKIPDVYKQNKLAKMKPQQKIVLYFPDYFPPFFNFAVDEQGRLFVLTYEQDDNSFNYIDIFNPDGVYVGRATISSFSLTGGYSEIKSRNNHLYFLKEKDSGYKELVVYRMIWK